MSIDLRIKEISEQLVRPESVEAVRTVLARIDQLPSEPELWLHLNGLIRRAFGSIRELTVGDDKKATTVMIEDLLPRCLRPVTEVDSQKLPRYDIVLGEWLASLSEERRHEIRKVALPRALNSLDGQTVQNALRLIGSIDYWDQELLNRLDDLIEIREDDVGDQALSVRVWLCPAEQRAPWLLSQLHARIARGVSRYRVFAASGVATNGLAMFETAELIWLHWLAPRLDPTVNAERDVLLDLSLSILGEIAAQSRDGALPERVWSWLLQLNQTMPQKPGNNLILTSGLCPRLNVAHVIPEVLRLALYRCEIQPYFHYRLLRQCALPAHLTGWDTVPPENLKEVQEHATTPTGMTGRFSTVALDQKEAAWDVMLCKGERSLLPALGDALAGEPSGFVLNRFLELAGCLALPSLPTEVSELLATVPAREAWSDQERLIAQIGAIRAAHGATDWEALDALLGYHQVGPGVLLSLIEALAETAIRTLGTGDRSPVDRILEAAETAPRKDTRAAASGAVSILLEGRHLSSEEIARAATVTGAPGTDPYARRELLFAFETLDPGYVPASVFEYASAILDHDAGDESWDPRSAALTVLARDPKSRSDDKFLTTRLGLIINDSGVAAGPRSFGGVIPYVVGRYFVTEPERFGPAVVSIISEGNAAALSNLLPAVRKAGPKCTPEVIESLVARLQRAQGGLVAELPLIEALAAVAPERLLMDGCREMQAWLPQARADLADILGRLTDLSDSLDLQRFDLLVKLAGDGIYAVRRAAYRAAAGCNPERLARLVHSWSVWHETGREGPRRRAAECAGWLSSGFTVSIRALGWDQEPGVREAYRRSMNEHKERLRSREYEERVLSVRESHEVVGAWRYGVALSQVGDDLTIHRLVNRISGDLPPSVRFWLSRVRDGVERRWKDVTQKWPEPWYARPGNLEAFTGTIRTDNHATPVAGILWLVHGEHPSELSSWGGWGATEGHVGTGELVLLVIPGRLQGKIIITSSQIPEGSIVFSGSGPYPAVS